MKKNVLFFLIASFIITYFSCTKNDEPFDLKNFKDPFVNEAVIFVRNNISKTEFETLDLNDFSLMKKNEKEIIGIKFNVKGTEGKRFAVVGKTNKGLIGNWVDVSKLVIGERKDGALSTTSFSGQKKTIASFTGNRLTKVNSITDGKQKTTIFRYNANGERLVTTIGERISGPDSEEIIELPEIIVVGYYRNSYVNYYSLFYYFNCNPFYNYTYQTTDPYIYGYEGGGGGSSSVVNLQPFEILSGPQIDLSKRMNCFNNVPTNSSTTYSVTLYADIPDNYDPEIVAVGTTPGHAFITLTKTNGTISVSQTFGFYPLNGAKSLTFAGVDSKIVNDEGHEYNTKITITNVTQFNFDAAKNLALSNANLQYDLNDFNCTDYAVSIFNQVMPNNSQLNIPDQITPVGINYKTTPNGLYKLLNQMKQGGDQFASNIQVNTGNGAASGGECN